MPQPHLPVDATAVAGCLADPVASTAFVQLLAAFQQLFANDGTEEGLLTAQEIGRVLAAPLVAPPGSDPTFGAWTNVFVHPDALLEPLLRAAAPCLPWAHDGLSDGKIPEAAARRMLTAELIGPDSVLHSDTLRLGLFWQDAGVSYPSRSHAAEECYILLAGEGGWSLDHAPFARRRPGEVLRHASYAPHASETTTHPMLAVWRWTGQISWDSYRCTG